MKRFAINLISSFLAFAAGLVTASSWNSYHRPVAANPVSVNVLERCPPSQTQAPFSTPRASLTVPPDREYVFGQGRLKLVPEKVQLKSESMHYDIDVKYPQIVGEGSPGIQKINQHIKSFATAKYQWPLKVSKEEVRLGQEKLPGTFNSVNVDYEISLATDTFLSFYFVGYSYGVGAAHAVQESVAMNYDLNSGQQLKLSDLFKRGSKYLEFISEYCIEDLSQSNFPSQDKFRSNLNKQALAPVAKNFDSWHITTGGIMFNFDACEVFACAEGDQGVEIPFSDLKKFFNPGIPAQFKITYP